MTPRLPYSANSMSDFNGILIADKPQDFTSFDLCAKLRRLIGQKKIGHAGTLDPMATGVMTILLGQATRAAELLPVQDKRYRAAFKFGVTSDTLDIWGKLSAPHPFCVSRDMLCDALAPFRGDITQIPPMYSAVHSDGRRLYELARQGIEVERQSRAAHIGHLELLDYDEQTGEGELDVLCSKGTYIRTLIDDIGAALGCGAVMTGLRRTMAAGFDISQALTLAQMTALCEKDEIAAHILPVDSAFEAYPRCTVSDAQAVRYYNGGDLDLARVHISAPTQDGGYVRVYGGSGFIGLAHCDLSAGALRPYKRFS